MNGGATDMAHTDGMPDGRARRFLIVVGLPKAGTTFLHSQCEAQPAHFNMPSSRKEIDYFRGGHDSAHYLGFFGPEAAADKVHVDASPLYLDDLPATLDNITACLPGQQVMIVVCLRPPLERTYSHYLHDVAQNLPVVGQGAYSIYDPAVLGKYLYPMQSRIAELIRVFGRDNVFGFAFGADNSRFETALRDFARLPAGWGFDYSHNPAPGFTSPAVYYQAARDSAVSLREGVFTLPAGQMLMVSRQFSQLYPHIAPRIGQAMLLGQASITRVFDTGRFSPASHARIRDDFVAATALLGLSLPPEAADTVLVSRLSDSIPQRLIDRLVRIDDLDAAVARAYDAPLQGTDATILATPEPPGSVARGLAAISAAVRRRDDGRMTVPEHLAAFEAIHGLPPDWMDSLVRNHIVRRQFDALEALLHRYGGARGLLRVPSLKSYHATVKPPLTADEIRRLAALGLTVPAET